MQFCLVLIVLWFSNIGKLQGFKYVFVPILTSGHESWVMTERVLSQVQAAVMEFLWRVQVVTLDDKVHNCDIFVSRMWQGRLVRPVLLATPKAKWPRSCPRTECSDDISDLAWPCLGVRPEERSQSGVDRSIPRSPWDAALLPFLQVQQLWNRMNEWWKQLHSVVGNCFSV